jgi:hypothetical protein
MLSSTADGYTVQLSTERIALGTLDSEYFNPNFTTNPLNFIKYIILLDGSTYGNALIDLGNIY